MLKGIVIAFILVLLFPVTACAEQEDGGAAEVQEEAAYTIMKVDGGIDWDKIPTAAIDHVLWTDDYGIRGSGQLCYDDENLYVHLRAVEKEIRAENTEPLSPVYEDSCLEFFFMPEGSDKYFNIEANPNGCLCLQYGPSKTDRINIVRDDAADYFDIRTDRTDDGWEIFYRVPLEYIQFFCPGYHFEGDLRANLYKCGNKTVHAHYLSWSPIDLPSPNFHCPEYFGTMHFAES